MVAEAVNYGMNRWTQDSDFKTVLEDLAVDYQFAWCVALVSPTPRPESYEAEDPILWPQVTRISPWDFGFDHRAPTWRRARMLWHRYRIDKEELIERARLDRKLPKAQREGWNLDAIMSLSSAPPVDSRLKKLRGDHAYSEPDRDEVEILEVHLPGHQLPGAPGPEDGFNGTRLTLGSARNADDGVYLQDPKPAFGPRWGRYVVGGTYIVPDSPYPLSVLVATAGMIEQSTRIARAVDAQVEAYKRLMLVTAGAPDIARIIKDGKTDHVFSIAQVAELAKMVQSYEVGGTTNANLAAEARAINKRNRAMGFDEVQRGNVEGSGTATEVQLAVEASLGRQGYMKGRFQDAVRRIGKTVAWDLYHTDEIIFPLGEEAAQALGLAPDEEAWFRGGDYEDGSGTTFDDLGLEIEPYSMERPSEAFLRQRGELVANLIQLAPALPALQQVGGDVKGILDAYGDAYGMPNLSRLFPGIEDMDPSMIQPAAAQPQLGRDAGLQGLLKMFTPRATGAPQPGGMARGGQQSPQGLPVAG